MATQLYRCRNVPRENTASQSMNCLSLPGDAYAAEFYSIPVSRLTRAQMAPKSGYLGAQVRYLGVIR